VRRLAQFAAMALMAVVGNAAWAQVPNVQLDV